MPDLSVIIPARNEMFLLNTVEDVLKNMRGDTEIIVVLEGKWPEPGLDQDPRVKVLFNVEPVGQRAATNQGARLSDARFVMKLDAHCAVDEGFDVKLMEHCEPDWTVIPRMYNLHVFDWHCKNCKTRWYQGPTPTTCKKCGSVNAADFERRMVWKPRLHRKTDFARFDSTLHFQYWGGYESRPEAQGDIVDVMSFIGACFFMRRDRYFELEGLDERHGSWGQMGTEIACKSWLSGGRLVVNKKTWFSHLFRTQGGDFGFPYHLPNSQVEHARKHSRDLWLGNKWPKAKRKLDWLIQKFAPVPDWPHQPEEKVLTKGVVYYTENQAPVEITEPVRQRLKNILNGHKLVSVSLKPLQNFGHNVVLPLERGTLTMFRQILAGLEACDADVVFFCEHDVLYHPSHFEFTPPRKDVYYYNEHTYKVDAITGRAVFYYTKQTSGLCAYRQLLIDHYRARIERCEREPFTRAMGFEPGCHRPPRGVDNFPAERWMSPYPNVDIRHSKNLTQSRWDPSEFRNPKACEGWKEVDEIPGWGVVAGRFMEFVQESIK